MHQISKLRFIVVSTLINYIKIDTSSLHPWPPVAVAQSTTIQLIYTPDPIVFTNQAASLNAFQIWLVQSWWKREVVTLQSIWSNYLVLDLLLHTKSGLYIFHGFGQHHKKSRHPPLPLHCLERQMRHNQHYPIAWLHCLSCMIVVLFCAIPSLRSTATKRVLHFCFVDAIILTNSSASSNFAWTDSWNSLNLHNQWFSTMQWIEPNATWQNEVYCSKSHEEIHLHVSLESWSGGQEY